MNARIFDESQVPNRHVTDGTSRALHRAYPNVMGLMRGQIRQAAGVGSCWREAAPRNIATERQGMIPRMSDGDIFAIGLTKEPASLHLGDADFAERGQNYELRKTEIGSGALCGYAHLGRPVVAGAAPHLSVLEEAHVYADI
ncbi:hypothetical protein RZS28_10030 [Methylocapsa polymorpha]|uniref:Uncharacterized protein n=1 Tax=Methylocapsa polymorpha TaxID=3080828 RepID=A0ABZ0HN66_9HYPH|nr:hypothetical protein RZS28_10030 [Methylocapsa sp. RX1]